MAPDRKRISHESLKTASNNLIIGEYDGSSNHTDGNGIILDLSNGSNSSANTPPALIINNVVYGNAACKPNVVTNFCIINNTWSKNDLDTSLGNVGSFSTQGSSAQQLQLLRSHAAHQRQPAVRQRTQREHRRVWDFALAVVARNWARPYSSKPCPRQRH